VLVEKIGIEGKAKPTDPAAACKEANAHWMNLYPHNATLEFSRDRKSMSTLCGYVPPEGSAPSNTPGRQTRSASKGKGSGEPQRTLLNAIACPLLTDESCYESAACR
jgi:hypothetical protein